MKKKQPVYLFVLALLFVAVGLYGVLTKNVSDGEASASETKVNEKVSNAVRDDEKRLSGREARDLLSVRGSDGTVMKDYEGFRLCFNTANHTPDWVAWELLGSEADGPVSRKGHDKFWQDDEIEGCAAPSDYTRSGYDKGHMCPAGDQKWSVAAMENCFSMANMAPQDNKLNTGAWKTLENKERLWAQRDSAIVIVAGPIYEESDTKRIGETGVRVPGAFYKVIIAPYLDEPRGIAFVYPNMTSPGNMENYVMTIDAVEKMTGLDFFHELPDDMEEAVESVASFREWNR